MRKYYSLLLVLIFITSSSGQVKIIRDRQAKIIKTQGTGPGANVHCGLQDKAGNLWFGTTGEGVYRYDGKSFTNFTVKDGLSDNNVWSVLEDKTGNIWFGTADGACRYDPSAALRTGSEAFTHIPVAVTSGSNFYPYTSSNPNPSAKNEVWSMLQDKSGQIWFGTTDGVYRYDGKSFTRFLQDDGIINKDGLQLRMVPSILEDKTGNIWFTTWFEGVCRYDGKSITSFKPNGEVWFAYIFEDRAGNIWAGRRSKGVCRYDGKTFSNVLQNGVFDSCSVRPLAEDKWGNIWFGSEFGDMTRRETMGGLWCYDGKSFKNFTMKDGLSNNSVWTIVEDRAGNLWVGTRNTGLCRYDGKTFTSFSE